MALSINHFSIRTTDLDATRLFYEGVLGLTVGPRPDLPFPGVWMYQGDHGDTVNAAVHIIGLDREQPKGLGDWLGERDETTLSGTGTIDHVAFFADGLAAMLDNLQARGVPFRQRAIPDMGLHQVFLDDPNGCVIELNYKAAEAAGLAA